MQPVFVGGLEEFVRVADISVQGPDSLLFWVKARPVTLRMMELEQDSSDSLHCLSGLPFLNAENCGLVHPFFLIEKRPEVEHFVYLVDILGVVDDHLVPRVGSKDLFPELNLVPEMSIADNVFLVRWNFVQIDAKTVV